MCHCGTTDIPKCATLLLQSSKGLKNRQSVPPSLSCLVSYARFFLIVRTRWNAERHDQCRRLGGMPPGARLLLPSGLSRTAGGCELAPIFIHPCGPGLSRTAAERMRFTGVISRAPPLLLPCTNGTQYGCGLPGIRLIPARSGLKERLQCMYQMLPVITPLRLRSMTVSLSSCGCGADLCIQNAYTNFVYTKCVYKSENFLAVGRLRRHGHPGKTLFGFSPSLSPPGKHRTKISIVFMLATHCYRYRRTYRAFCRRTRSLGALRTP